MKQIFKFRIIMVVMIIAMTIIALSTDSTEKKSDHRKPDKVILQMKMTPIENSPGEFILEYDNGSLEILRADGTREPLIQTPKSKD